MNLVAGVMVKNELSRYLQACIASLREFCDTIAVLDDGSTDRSGEWLDDNADQQLRVKHIDPQDGFFAGHEGRRRQALLEFTMEQTPTWILAIDADEFVADGQRVRGFCESPRMVGSLVMQEVWEVTPTELRIRMDGGWRPHPIPILFRPMHGRHWFIQDRALACGREPVAVKRHAGRARPTGTEILHFGWADPDTRQERHDRYAIADGGRFHANTHLESILWTDDRVKLGGRKWPAGLKDHMR